MDDFQYIGKHCSRRVFRKNFSFRLFFSVPWQKNASAAKLQVHHQRIIIRRGRRDLSRCDLWPQKVSLHAVPANSFAAKLMFDGGFFARALVLLVAKELVRRLPARSKLFQL